MRANWIGAPEFFNLNNCCSILSDAFGETPYLVGSAIERRDFRDVDVRLIMDDVKFDKLFPKGLSQRDPFWSLLCASVSEWLSARSGLKIDFQIQRRTEANAQFTGPRQGLGVYMFQKAGG